MHRSVTCFPLSNVLHSATFPHQILQTSHLYFSLLHGFYGCGHYTFIQSFFYGASFQFCLFCKPHSRAVLFSLWSRAWGWPTSYLFANCVYPGVPGSLCCGFEEVILWVIENGRFYCSQQSQLALIKGLGPLQPPIAAILLQFPCSWIPMRRSFFLDAYCLFIYLLKPQAQKSARCWLW